MLQYVADGAGGAAGARLSKKPGSAEADEAAATRTRSDCVKSIVAVLGGRDDVGVLSSTSFDQNRSKRKLWR